MSEANVEEKQTTSKGRNPILLIGGMFLLGLALAVLLFGNQLIPGLTQSEAFVQEPASSSSGLNREDVPLPDRGAPLNVGDIAHDFGLPDLDGQQVALADFKGKPVIINFWATWCPPCRIEMPELQRAFEEYQEDDLVILAVNESERPDQVQSFFYDEMGYTYTPLLDEEAEVGEMYGAVGLPTTFFVNSAGEVTAIHRGVLTQSQIESYLEETIQ